ncbi:MAG: hypothetical protein U0457_00670 [Candidatus Sericytochromatia bacterium]
MKNNISKIGISIFTAIFTVSCSFIQSTDNTKFKIPTEKVAFKLNNGTEEELPPLLTFESKVPIKSLSMVKELPSGRTFKFSFEVSPKKIERNTIKIPSNGNFNLTIKRNKI